MNLYKVENAAIDRIGFKKEMSNVEIWGIEAIINDMAADELIPDVETLGMAYTSSSTYAMHNVCNGEFWYDGNIISHFAILTDGRMLLVSHDEEENEHYYIVEG